MEGDDGTTVEKLKLSIEAKLLRQSPLPSSCCIFKVPEVIRRQKKEAYEPNIVSIGPFHHGNEKFQLFEDVKRWYLHCLIFSSERVSWEDLFQEDIMRLAKSASGCYVPNPLDGDLDQNKFVEMMILDSCFLLELFRKANSHALQNYNDDPAFSMPCMQEHLYHDLLLLENQLPWSVLQRLYNLTANSSSDVGSSLASLVLNFFRQSEADERMLKSSLVPPGNILHILDLIRSVIVYGFKSPEEEPRKGPKLPQRIPNATSLSEAGVRFKQSQNKEECIMNIEFENGVLTIPELGIEESTEPLFRNLIAFEQCYHGCPHKITSHAVLMDNLIDSREDIDFLCHEGILANWLNPDDAAQFFNKLYNDTTVMGYYYSDLSDKVNEHYKAKWPKFMEILRRDYCSTPWRIVSSIAAIILLVLTLVQTLYTIRWP